MLKDRCREDTALELEEDTGVEVSGCSTVVAVVEQSVSIRYDGFIAHVGAFGRGSLLAGEHTILGNALKVDSLFSERSLVYLLSSFSISLLRPRLKCLLNTTISE